MYKDGRGVAKDYKNSLRWLRISANQDEHISELAIGDMYITGQGVLKDMGKARFWVSKAYEGKNKEISKVAKVIWDKNELWKYTEVEDAQKSEPVKDGIKEKDTRSVYIDRIAQKVKEQWRYQGGSSGWGCDVYFTQDKSGSIQNIKIQRCVIDNYSKEDAFKKSIIKAIKKASPLPYTNRKDIYDSNIMIHLKID
jgi:TPR repeat protein